MAATALESADKLIERTYTEMRWRILSLAADIDRIERADGGKSLLQEARMQSLQACIQELLSDSPGRAERIQIILSDLTPPPAR